MDTRNSYRVVKSYSKEYERVQWSAQYRPWWCPFYITLYTYCENETARARCHRHADAWQRAREASKPEVTKLGKLP